MYEISLKDNRITETKDYIASPDATDHMLRLIQLLQALARAVEIKKFPGQ